jgi:dipeptidyl aminopeptidase/acylaminoacyl peptidase
MDTIMKRSHLMTRLALFAMLGVAHLAMPFAPAAQQPQPPANTEVFSAQLNLAGTPMLGGPVTNLSQSPGYDSQPSFLPDGSGLLFSSQREGTQYDIYKYDFASRSVSQVTKTAENENSPLVTPDGRSFSAVQTEADRTQRLWRFNLDGTNPRLVLEQVKPVGYHVWVDPTHLALFVLGAAGQPNTLQYADTATGRSDVIDTRIGRSLLMRPRTGTVSFISQPQGAPALIKEFDPKTREIRTLVPALENSQDCVWLPNGVLLMSSGAKIFAWTPPAPGATGATSVAASPWVEAGDFSSLGLSRITRMAVGPATGGTPRFALVAEPVAR